MNDVPENINYKNFKNYTYEEIFFYLSEAVVGAGESIELILNLNSPLKDYCLEHFPNLSDSRLDNKLIIAGTPQDFGKNIKEYNLDDKYNVRKINLNISEDLFCFDRQNGYCLNYNYSNKFEIPFFQIREDILQTHLAYFNFIWDNSDKFVIYDNLTNIISLEQENKILIYTNEFYENLINELRKRPKDLFTLDSRRFEELVEHILKYFGYKTFLTPRTRDGGVDIYANYKTPDGTDIICLVECKRYSSDRNVSVDCIRSIFGLVSQKNANLGMIVTTSSFTKDARKFQEKTRNLISLKDYNNLIEWINLCR